MSGDADDEFVVRFIFKWQHEKKRVKQIGSVPWVIIGSWKAGDEI
jgi:hypothetical protein